MDTKPEIRFLTASLHVDFLKPTPLGVPLQVRASIKEIKDRKVVVVSSVLAEGVETARGEVVAVQMPEQMMEELRSGGSSVHVD
jgi:acyl-CoA thioesterase FadM